MQHKQIGWVDEFGNLFPIGAWRPAAHNHQDAHKTAWRPVYNFTPAELVLMNERWRKACTLALKDLQSIRDIGAVMGARATLEAALRSAP